MIIKLKKNLFSLNRYFAMENPNKALTKTDRKVAHIETIRLFSKLLANIPLITVLRFSSK